MGEINAPAVRDLVKTGDLLLFGKEGLVPGLFRWFARSRWSHIGIALGRPDDEPLLWEAVPHAGSRGHRGALGTRVVRLYERIRDFPGEASLRPLNRKLSGQQCEGLDALRRELATRHTQRSSLLDLMGAADDGWIGREPAHLSAPLPAELIATAYQRIGLLEDVRHGGAPAGDYAPRDFATGGRVRLKGGFALGPAIALQIGPPATGRADLTPQPA